MNFSKRSKMMPSSPIRKLVPYADEAKKDGVHVYHLNIGQPDIETPDAFFNAIKNFDKSVLEYAPSAGLMSLREEISKYFQRFNTDVQVEDVCVTTGGSEAIMFAMNVACDINDEVIVFEPFYANYAGYAAMSEIKLVPVTLKAEDGFHCKDFSKIEDAITPRTKAILIGSPNNPTGTVLSKEEITKIYEIAQKNDLFLISDEVYKEFIYSGEKHFSVLDLPKNDRVVVIDSISKRFSACGARIGALVTKNKDFMERVLKSAMARLCPPTLEMIGAEEAYKLPKEFFKPIIDEYKKRRDICYNIISKNEKILLKKPEGAFYLIAKLPVKNAELFSRWMLSDYRLNGKTTMVAPAAGFYISPSEGIDEIRIAYILKEDDLRDALHILMQGLEKYIEIEDDLLDQIV